MTKQERIESLKEKINFHEDRLDKLRSNHEMDERIKESQIESALKLMENIRYDLRILTS